MIVAVIVGGGGDVEDARRSDRIKHPVELHDARINIQFGRAAKRTVWTNTGVAAHRVVSITLIIAVQRQRDDAVAHAVLNEVGEGRAGEDIGISQTIVLVGGRCGLFMTLCEVRVCQ